MKITVKLIFVCLVSLCSACDSSLNGLFESSPFNVNSGPLTIEEIQAFTSDMAESISDDVATCLAKEATVRAAKIGDPETLEPGSVEMLPAKEWVALDKAGKRVILTQVVINQAILPCTQGI